MSDMVLRNSMNPMQDEDNNRVETVEINKSQGIPEMLSNTNIGI
jgi:hypothetical protein